jgi:hypothetical protein
MNPRRRRRNRQRRLDRAVVLSLRNMLPKQELVHRWSTGQLFIVRFKEAHVAAKRMVAVRRRAA